MEDEETGELFLPCISCSRKCYEKHGKYHKKERFEGCVSFFKVLLGDFEEKLRIPPAIVSQLINEADEHVVLQGPGGKEWDVQLCNTNNKWEFRQGWEKLVNHYRLEFGDFAVFKYVSKRCFKVQIFGRSACVKNVGLDKKHLCNKKCSLIQPVGCKKSIDLVCDDENEDESEVVAEHQRRKRKSSLIGHSPKEPGHLVSSILKKLPFKSDKPFRLMKMTKSSVKRPYLLKFSKRSQYPLENPLELPRATGEVVLVDGDSKEWKINCILSRKIPIFSGGWVTFVVDNNLEEGNYCIFEQMDSNIYKCMFRVHIFREVEES